MITCFAGDSGIGKIVFIQVIGTISIVDIDIL